jgi:hypothetical protein
MTLSGHTGAVTRWEKRVDGGGWTTIANTAVTYSETPSGAGTWEYRAFVTSGTCSGTYSSVRTIVVNPATVGGSISGGSTPICQGTGTGVMTLSGYTGSIVRWEKRLGTGSWTNISNTTATYSETPGSAGTWEYHAVVQSGACSAVYSSSKFIVVDPTSVGGSISGGTTPLCIGSGTGTMTLSGHTGSVTRWEKRVDGGGWTSIANTAVTYSETPSGAGTWEYRALVTSGTCTGVYSSVRTIVINPATTGGSISGGSTPICRGSATGTMTLSGYVGNIIKWQKRLGTGSWSDISNTTATYSETPTSSGTWEYRAVIQSGVCSSVNSSSRFIVVDPTSVGGSITGGTTPLCIGSATGTMTLSGHTGAVTRWEKRVDGGGWTTIANTAVTYSETPSGAGTWDYRAFVTSGTCAGTYSSIRTIVVNPATVGGSISGGSTPVCQGSGTGTMTLSGYTGSIIRWEKKLGTGTWTSISNTSATYSETPTSAGTWEYRALVQSGACASAYSSSRTIVVDPTSVGGTISGGTTPLCIGSATGNMTLSGHTGSVTRWEKRVDGGGWTSIANTAVTYSETPSGAGTWEYRALVTSGICTGVYSSVRTIVVDPASAGGAISGGITPVCQSINTGLMTLSGYTGTISKWQKRVDGGSWSDISTTAATYSEVPSAAGTWEYRAQVISGSCPPAYSSVRTIVVEPTLIAGVIGSSQSKCSPANPDPFTEVTPASGGLGPYSYQWKSSLTSGGPYSNIAGATGVSHDVLAGLTVTTYYVRTVTSKGVCGTKTSNEVSVVVYPGQPTISPGLISGEASVCQDGTLDIDISDVPSATEYVWDYSWLPGTEDASTVSSNISIDLSGFAPGT